MADPEREILYFCTPVSMNTSKRNTGIVNLFRPTVMRLLRDIDEDGVKQRAKGRLKRRVYRSKVT